MWHTLSPLKAGRLVLGPLHCVCDLYILYLRTFKSYSDNMVCASPKEKEVQGTCHLGRRGAWNENRKEVTGVHTACSSLSTGGEFRGRQNSVMAKRTTSRARPPGAEDCLVISHLLHLCGWIVTLSTSLWWGLNEPVYADYIPSGTEWALSISSRFLPSHNVSATVW